jgi:hypothetical protein
VKVGCELLSDLRGKTMFSESGIPSPQARPFGHFAHELIQRVLWEGTRRPMSVSAESPGLDVGSKVSPPLAIGSGGCLPINGVERKNSRKNWHKSTSGQMPPTAAYQPLKSMKEIG